jgi:RNA polymerase sigma-70 factor, ECF subfamily
VVAATSSTSRSGAAAPSTPPASATGGDELARAFAEQRPALRRLLRSFKIPPEDAEDLLQKTLLLAVMKQREIERPGAWLFGTLRTLCAVYCRKRRKETWRVHELDAPGGELLVPPVAPEGQQQRERRLLLAELARGLPPHQRRVLMLRYQLGMQDVEVAAATGLAPISVRRTSLRAVERMRAAGAPPAAPEPARSGEVLAGGGRWAPAIAVYLLKMARNTRSTYAGHLRAAQARLACGTLAELTGERLRGFRAEVLADGRSRMTQATAITTLRGFLLWAGLRRRHQLDPALIRESLGLPAGFFVSALREARERRRGRA